MTLITGTVQALGYEPLSGELKARAARFRADGGVIFAPERRPYKIDAGLVSVELAPGPAKLEISVGSHAKDEFDVVIPDQESITLADLLDTVFPWEPEQVSKFVAERLLAEEAKDDAQTAKGDAEQARTDTQLLAQQTSQDRTAVADDKAVVVGHVQALAAPNDAAVLGLISEGATTQTKAALNATYPSNDLTSVRVPAETTFAAIQAALTIAKTSGEKVVAGGAITTDQTLVIECDCDLSQLSIDYTGTGTAVQVGIPEAATLNKYARLPRVRHTGKTQTGWGQVAGTIGVRLINLNSWPQIDVPFIESFEQGLVEHGMNGKGHAYNGITIGYLLNNKRNHVMQALDSGWSNENVHYGGRFAHLSAEGVSVPGVKHIDVVGGSANLVNNNMWVKPSLEGAANEWVYDCAGPVNMLLSPRMERPGGAFMRWGDGASHCMIIGGYNSHQLNVTWMPGAARNEIVTPGRHQFFGNTAEGPVQMMNSSSATEAVWSVLNPSSPPSTDAWVWRATAQRLMGRRSTDTFPRIYLDSLNGRVYFGNGSAEPGAYIGAYGNAGTTFAGHIAFSPDNTHDVGNGAFRPRDVRAGRYLQVGNMMLRDNAGVLEVSANGTTWKAVTLAP